MFNFDKVRCWCVYNDISRNGNAYRLQELQ